MQNKINFLIPMAGEGKRFVDAGYKLPKPLLDINGEPTVIKVIDNFNHPNISFIFCVLKEHCEKFNLDKVILARRPDSKIIIIDEILRGPVMTCLKAKEYIDNDTPLIIVNCDQIIFDWSFEKFFDFVRYTDPDAILGTFKSSSPKNSYVRLDELKTVIECVEKKVISDDATNGLHYWKHGSDFVNAANKTIENNDSYNGEFYISNTIKYLINQGKCVRVFEFKKHYPIGIPEDYEKFIRDFHRLFTIKKSNIHGLKYIPSFLPPNNDDQDSYACVGYRPSEEISEKARETVRRLVQPFNGRNNGILEIGICRNGSRSFTHILIEEKGAAPYLGVDIEDKRFLDDKARNIHTLQCDSKEIDLVKAKLKDIGVEKLSVILIDGWHSINMVINDWKYTELLEQGGVVIFHDVNTHPVKFVFDAIDENLYTKENWLINDNDSGIGSACKI